MAAREELIEIAREVYNETTRRLAELRATPEDTQAYRDELESVESQNQLAALAAIEGNESAARVLVFRRKVPEEQRVLARRLVEVAFSRLTALLGYPRDTPEYKDKLAKTQDLYAASQKAEEGDEKALRQAYTLDVLLNRIEQDERQKALAAAELAEATPEAVAAREEARLALQREVEQQRADRKAAREARRKKFFETPLTPAETTELEFWSKELGVKVTTRTQLVRLRRASIDDDLIDRYVNQGDDKALEALLKHYRGFIRSVAFERVKKYDAVSDVMAVVFEKVAKNLKTNYRGKTLTGRKTMFFTWLYRLTINAANDGVREWKRRKEFAEKYGATVEYITREMLHQNAEARKRREREEAAERARRRDLSDLLPVYNKLPRPHQIIMYLLAEKQMTYKQLSKALRIPMGTVMSRIHHARNNIQRLKEGLPLNKRGRPPKWVKVFERMVAASKPAPVERRDVTSKISPAGKKILVRKKPGGAS